MLRFTLACLLAIASPAASLTAAASPIGEVYRRVQASVVVIATEQKEVDPSTQIGLVDVGGLGSGVLISEDGRVLTAAHVVQTAETIAVVFMGGETISARVVASEPAADVSLLQLDRMPETYQVAPLGDSDRVQVGDEIFVVGAPLGISHSLSVGHISARRLEAEVFGGLLETEMFQTDAAINEGNSGGPMFDLRGEVIGIVSHIISQGGGFEGLGFVITSNVAHRMLLERPSLWSGMQGHILSGELAQILNVPQRRGILVQRVASGSPAADVGLRDGRVHATIGDVELVLGGDVILEVQGISLAEPGAGDRIRARLGQLRPGARLRLKVLRGGRVLEMEHHLSSRDLPPAARGS